VTFFSVVIVVLVLTSISIYFFSENYRREDFLRRLKNRAINTAKVLIEVKEINAELLRRMERNNPASLPNQYIVIYDYNNHELYSSDNSQSLVVDAKLLKRVKDDKEITFQDRQLEAIGFLFTDHGDHFVVIAAATDVYGLNALHNLGKILLVTFCISIIFVSLLGWIYAGKVLKPISKIVNQVSDISEMNLSRRLDVGNNKDELSKLSQTFNNMLERLHIAFLSQKNFIANASHEIKTPITVMSAEIDVSLLQKRDHDYYINVLKSVLLGLKGLNKLSSQLLWLAQTNTSQSERNFTLFRIDDVLWEVNEEFVKVFPNYLIDVEFDLKLNYDSLLIEGDEQLMKIAIQNLTENGCKYSEDHHTIIQLDSNTPNYLTIRFKNNGQGIFQDDIDKIFEPFYRAKADRKIKGSGIGLSLVKGIVKLHNGAIAVTSVPGVVTEFTIKLPVKKQKLSF
jgi:signal transduction histidine kinase